MTWYAVQLVPGGRWYNVEADNEDEAKQSASAVAWLYGEPRGLGPFWVAMKTDEFLTF